MTAAADGDLTVDQEQAILSKNPRPEHPRPSMTFMEQAQLLEHIHGRYERMEDGRYAIAWLRETDQAELDDLWLTAQRLRRMAGHEDEIRRVVTGR